VNKISPISDDDVAAMIDGDLVQAHRDRALSPEHPVLRGSAQNPDVFFQAREAASPFYARTPALVEAEMARFAAMSGRRYSLFDYSGAPDASRIIVLMGSGAGAVQEAVEALNARGVTLIVVTHDQSMGARARRQLVMEDGRLQSDSGAAEISILGKISGRP